MNKTKKITKSGSITLPKELRTETGIYPQTAVDISTNGTEIIIKPHLPTCRICGAVIDVISVYSCGVDICLPCIAKIVEAVNESD